MAEMNGVWYQIENPDRTAQQDLNITVYGAVVLSRADLTKLPGGGLFTIKIQVWDDDTFSDDIVWTDQSFQLGVYDLSPRPFVIGVIVPWARLRQSEPSYENTAEIYVRVSAQSGPVKTNARNSGVRNVKIR